MVHADAATIPDEIKTKREFYAHLSTQLSSLVEDQRNWVSNLSNASSIIYASLNRFQQRLAEQQEGSSTGYKAKTVNWAGFYLLSPFLPTSTAPSAVASKPLKRPTLLLGPFCGLPACQQIQSVPGRGVCADASALLPPRAVRVDRTDDYPGHIACDSASKSEIVVPLVISRSKQLSTHHQAALRGSAPAGNAVNGSSSSSAQADTEAASATEADERATKSQKVPIPIEWQGRGEEDEIIIGVLDIDCEEEEGFDKDDEEGLTAIAKLLADACDW